MGDAQGVSVPCSRDPALAFIFVRTMGNWGLFEPVELIYGAEHGKIHDKVIGILGRLGQIQSIKRDRGWRGQRIVRGAQPIGARDGEPTRLRVHARGEGEQLLEFGARGQAWDISNRVEHSEGRARVLDDLMGEKAWKGDIICTARRFGLARAWEPFEKEDEGADGLERRQGGRFEGIEIVDDKRYAKRLEKLAAAQSVRHSSQSDMIETCSRGEENNQAPLTHVKTPGSDSVSCQPLESSSADIVLGSWVTVYGQRKGVGMVEVDEFE